MTIPILWSSVFLLAFLSLSLILYIFNSKNKQKQFTDNANLLKEEIASLKGHIEKEKESQDKKELQLNLNIKDLNQVLKNEQESIKKRELELKNKEKQLEDSLAETQKNLEEQTEAKKKIASQKKSSEVRLGHIAEKLAPFLDDFTFDPECATFLGQPIDYIVFEDEEITFVEVKMGKSQLSQKQRHIRDLVKSKCVKWKEIRIKE
tara:strand:- start:2812 stop:3429 length:618 start_codon:yes stop_codon:yes gene_type:complete